MKLESNGALSCRMPKHPIPALLRSSGAVVIALALSGRCLGQSELPANTETAELTQTEPIALSTVPIPLPDNLDRFVKDRHKAVVLGKALFWDMQMGSDGRTACATCHWHAGADIRTRNTLEPGAIGGTFGPEGDDADGQRRLRNEAVQQFNAAGGPNQELRADQFPFHQVSDPDGSRQNNSVIRDSKAVVGSQGIPEADFVRIHEGIAREIGRSPDNPSVHQHGVPVRQVTGRNTPTTINAVFLDRLFWDGRARHHFNGVNPFGDLDSKAKILKKVVRNDFESKLKFLIQRYPGARRYERLIRRTPSLLHSFLPSQYHNGIESTEEVSILLNNAALASQAVGPVGSSVESGFTGRPFAEVGRKLISLRPLAQQKVHPNDSVLGPYANREVNGLDWGISYNKLISEAFHDDWWSAKTPTADGFTQMEANFSLFWGLSIMLYEATLISDQAPVDEFALGNKDALSPAAKRGMEIFFGAGRCINCHGGAEYAGAAISEVRRNRPNLVEFMAVQQGNAFYDGGFYNIGVRPTEEDLGVGATHPEFGPLSYAAQRQNGHNIGQDISVPPGARTAVRGAFKAPSLRNIELTGPYMHNGGMRTLTEVVQFYTRGADFFNRNLRDLDPDVDGIEELQNNPEGIADLVAFLEALTDERVRYNRAPFDHPELRIPNGHSSLQFGVAQDDEIRLPAVGAEGGAKIPTFEQLVPDDTESRLTHR